jgi:hypothetical protein
LKKKFIKGVRIPESCGNNERIDIYIDFCATFFAMYYSYLEVMEETDDRISGKLGDAKRKKYRPEKCIEKKKNNFGLIYIARRKNINDPYEG